MQQRTDQLAQTHAAGGSQPPSHVQMTSKLHSEGSSGPSHPLNNVTSLVTSLVTNKKGTASQYYTNNWAGAIITAPPSGETFNIVIASFVVPIPKPPVAGPGTWWGTAWVGIDGFTYGGAILQTGIDWGVQVNADGSTAYGYWGWNEWYPAGWSDFSFGVTGGDTIELVVEAPSLTTGMCALTNQRTGQSVSTMLSVPTGGSPLKGQNAEWIVEDYSLDGLVPFANFGTVTFNGCTAEAGKTVVAVDGTTASTLNIINSSNVPITQTNYPGTDQVMVSYV